MTQPRTGIALALAGLAFSAPIAVRAASPSTRAEAVSLYQTMYQATDGLPSGWTGNVASCNAGDVSAAYRNAGLQRVEYFRLMSGLLAGLALDATWNAKCQEAALMMTANRALSHSPPSTWTCYTAGGAEAAGKSNLAAGYASLASAVTGWMSDGGVSSLGHRRWVLYPPLVTSGLGATFGNSYPAYAMWVIGGNGTRPAQPEFVAWPPPTWVPYPVVFGVWSFSIPGANFAGASVVMRRGTTDIALTLQQLPNGYGDNTLAWTPQGLSGGAPATDTAYHVEVSNVVVGGQTRNFAYDVTIIDPAAAGTAVAASTWGAVKGLYRAPATNASH
jgi:uncharacterized protein YkwD